MFCFQISLSGFSFLMFFKVCFSLHYNSLWILRKYENLFFSKFTAFKIYALAHDIRKNTVIFIVISRSCHGNSPLFLLIDSPSVFMYCWKTYSSLHCPYHLTFPSAHFLFVHCYNCCSAVWIVVQGSCSDYLVGHVVGKYITRWGRENNTNDFGFIDVVL